MNQNQTDTIPYTAFPGFRLMILVIAGIVLSSYVQLDSWLTPVIFAVMFLLWFLSEFALKRYAPLMGVHGAALLYLVSAGGFGFALHELHEQKLGASVILGEKLDLLAWEEITIEGEIIRTGKNRKGNENYTVKVHSTTLPSAVTMAESYQLRLYSDEPFKDQIHPGSLVKAVVMLYEFPERRNPHEFDYGKWLHENGIAGHGRFENIISVKTDKRISWNRIRNKIRKNIDIAFSEETAPLAKALLLGYKVDLHPETASYFSRSGLSHIMAVSGLHVGFVVAPFWILIPLLWNIKHGKWLGLIGITLLLIFYAGITGFSPSVTRASLMAWFLTYGRLFHKVRNSINLTAVAAIIILMVNPSQLFSAGFQLSFSAVFIILFVMPRITAVLPYKYRFGLKGGLITIILVSIVVQAGLFPILALYFGEFSIVGPVANTLVLPLMSLIVPAGLLMSLLPVAEGSILQSGSHLIGYGLLWIEFVASALGSNKYTYLTFDEIPISIFGVWVSAIGVIASVHIPKVRWKMLAALLLFINIGIVELFAKKYGQTGVLEVTVLDVGQGDAIHIKTPGNKNILLDAGRWTPVSDSGEKIILPYLKENGIDYLDAVILSHPHADHIGGMVSLIGHVDIGAVYQSNFEYDSILFSTIQRKLAQKQIPTYYPSQGETILIDPTVRFFVLGPAPDTQSNNPNNYSLSFKLVYGETSFLFTGDAEEEQERRMASRYGDFLQSDVYKIGHHASNTSTTGPFIRAVQPEFTVGSLALRNKFRHPGRETVTRLHQLEAEQFYTSLDGAVVFRTDGKKVEWENWKE